VQLRRLARAWEQPSFTAIEVVNLGYADFRIHQQKLKLRLLSAKITYDYMRFQVTKVVFNTETIRI